VGEQVVYAVNVLAEGETAVGCGAPGKRVTFRVDGRTMMTSAVWDDRRVWNVALQPGRYVYLPLLLRD
jgi:hypothetical protein